MNQDKLRDIRKKRKSVWIRWGTMAACVCILLVSVYVIGNGDLKFGGADWQEDISVDSSESEENKSFEDTDKNTSNRVKSSKGLSSISLIIPKGWKYSISQSADESSDEFGISFWPEGQTQGKICIWYHSAWGVCGTGLEETKITLGDYLALQGTYDNKEVWDYICFNVTDSRGYYVALNEGAEVWWAEYGTEAMSILATVQITEGANVEYLD